ncbi:hypothetical protein HAX54_043803, partial [Datura stramonium]|nr:hypothetical protein [Datura stramonium]
MVWSNRSLIEEKSLSPKPQSRWRHNCRLYRHVSILAILAPFEFHIATMIKGDTVLPLLASRLWRRVARLSQHWGEQFNIVLDHPKYKELVQK